MEKISVVQEKIYQAFLFRNKKERQNYTANIWRKPSQIASKFYTTTTKLVQLNGVGIKKILLHRKSL